MKSGEFGPSSPGPQAKSKNYKNVVIGFLTLAVICLLIFVFANNNSSRNDQSVTDQSGYQKPIADLTTDEENDLRKSFDETLARLDSVKAVNATLTNELEARNKEIADTKAEIRRILNSKNVTASELKKAKEMIASLNETITSMEQDIAKLTQDNQTLAQEKEALVQQNQQLNQDLAESNELNVQLSEKVDVGSTLNASSIMITPIKIKNNDKEKVTHRAKKVDKFMITFDVSNRIAEPGMKDIYVTITDPDGKLITSEELGSGTFSRRNEGDQVFTTKVPVEVETSVKKKVEFSFKPHDFEFREGSYDIKIYQNGFMIGEGTSELKKGGLFG